MKNKFWRFWKIEEELIFSRTPLSVGDKIRLNKVIYTIKEIRETDIRVSKPLKNNKFGNLLIEKSRMWGKWKLLIENEVEE